MLIEKEVIAPGTYWYTDEATGVPRKLDVTPDLTRYWHEQGGKMLSAGLRIPVPYEHDFSAHPMTPKEKLLNNAGEVKEYNLKGDALWSVVDVQDPDVKRKIGRSIRWTSPWINSFVDGSGKRWNNVISHLALTTRPRIVKQAPFGSVAAALSMAQAAPVSPGATAPAVPSEGLCLTRATRLCVRRKTGLLQPQYPMAFSLVGGVQFAADEKPQPALDDAGDDAPAVPEDAGLPDPLADQNGDVRMEELLCDLLQALGVPMPDDSNEQEFKRHLYEAAMSKIKELAGKGAQAPPPAAPAPPGKPAAPGKPAGGNPLIQQEQQPMYMGLNGEARGGAGMAALSIDDINRIEDSTMRTVALAMFNENAALRQQLEHNTRVTEQLRAGKLAEAQRKRSDRIAMLSRLSPKVKDQLESMAGLQGMALSMGDDGAVVDPMRSTLDMLEGALADRVSMPRLLTTDMSMVTAQPQPTDADLLSAEGEAKLVDDYARLMGCAPQKAG